MMMLLVLSPVSRDFYTVVPEWLTFKGLLWAAHTHRYSISMDFALLLPMVRIPSVHDEILVDIAVLPRKWFLVWWQSAHCICTPATTDSDFLRHYHHCICRPQLDVYLCGEVHWLCFVAFGSVHLKFRFLLNTTKLHMRKSTLLLYHVVYMWQYWLSGSLSAASGCMVRTIYFSTVML